MGRSTAPGPGRDRHRIVLVIHRGRDGVRDAQGDRDRVLSCGPLLVGVKQQARKRAAATGGITVETRARFGYTAPVGTTDDPRERRLTVHLPPAYAARLFEAQQQGLGDQTLRDIVAEGLQEVYFKDGGTRAGGLEVEMTDVRYFDVSF